MDDGVPLDLKSRAALQQMELNTAGGADRRQPLSWITLDKLTQSPLPVALVVGFLVFILLLLIKPPLITRSAPGANPLATPSTNYGLAAGLAIGVALLIWIMPNLGNHLPFLAKKPLESAANAFSLPP